MTDENQASPPPTPETPAPDSTAAADPTPTTSAAPETGTAESAADPSTQGGPVYQHLRVILQDALAEIGKAEQFTADEIEKLWQAIAARV